MSAMLPGSPAGKADPPDRPTEESISRSSADRRWQAGATAIEYGIIAAFVALTVYVGALVAGNGLGEIFQAMSTQLNAAMMD